MYEPIFSKYALSTADDGPAPASLDADEEDNYINSDEPDDEVTEGSDYDEAFADEDLGHSSGSEDAVDDKPLSATGKPAKATPAASKATAPAGATAASKVLLSKWKQRISK